MTEREADSASVLTFSESDKFPERRRRREAEGEDAKKGKIQGMLVYYREFISRFTNTVCLLERLSRRITLDTPRVAISAAIK